MTAWRCCARPSLRDANAIRRTTHLLLSSRVDFRRGRNATRRLPFALRSFDRAMLPALDTHKWLCLYRLARHLWPDAPRHTVQVLRYWLGLHELHRGLPPHRALADVLVAAEIFRRALAAAPVPKTLDALDSFIASPIRVPRMPFGVHYGKPIAEVPDDYIAWALRNIDDMDPDLRWTLKNKTPGR